MLEEHTNTVRCVTTLPDGRIVSGSIDGTLRVWDLNTGECLWELEGHSNYVTSVTALPDGHIRSGSDDCTFRVWDVNSGKCLAVIPVSEMDVTGMDLFQAAEMDPDTARLLYYNGAAIRPADEQRLKK